MQVASDTQNLQLQVEHQKFIQNEAQNSAIKKFLSRKGSMEWQKL